MAKNLQDLCKEMSISLLELADRSGLDLPKLRHLHEPLDTFTDRARKDFRCDRHPERRHRLGT